MNEIRTNFKGSLVWSWILACIPTAFIYLWCKCAKYQYDDEQIYIKTGILKQSQTSVPFYRLKDVQSSEVPGLKCGSITLIEKEKTITLKYVDNPNEEANKLRKIMLEAKKKNGLNVLSVE